MSTRYWCHMCSQAVNPVEFKCPNFRSGFVEEMSEELNGGSSLREVQNQDIDDADGISNVDNNRRRHRDREHDEEIESDREVDSLIRRTRRSLDAIMQILQGIRDGTNSDQELDHLLRTITDPIRPQGTIPAPKEAVENLPTVIVCEPLQCSVCLEDFEKGSEAKEMPCQHKFHLQCIVPWLELHSSCPVCRYVLPTDEELKTDLLRSRTTSVGIINLSNENVEEHARNISGS